MRVDVVSTVTPADTAAVWAVYDVVFGDEAYGEWLVSPWGRHTARPGFRLARGFVSDELVGFAYGYTGERGQWWSDAGASVLTPAVAASWIGGHFEVVSLLGGRRRPGAPAVHAVRVAGDRARAVGGTRDHGQGCGRPVTHACGSGGRSWPSRDTRVRIWWSKLGVP